MDGGVSYCSVEVPCCCDWSEPADAAVIGRAIPQVELCGVEHAVVSALLLLAEDAGGEKRGELPRGAELFADESGLPAAPTLRCCSPSGSVHETELFPRRCAAARPNCLGAASFWPP